MTFQRVPRRAVVSVDRKRYRDSSDEESSADEERGGSPRKKSRTNKSKMNPKKTTLATASPIRNHKSNPTPTSLRRNASFGSEMNDRYSNRTSRIEDHDPSSSKRTFKKTLSLPLSITFDSSDEDHPSSLRTPPRQKLISNTDKPSSSWRSHCEEVPAVSQSQPFRPSPSSTPSVFPLSQRSNIPSELLSSPSPPPTDHSVSAEPEIAQLVWVKISKEGEIDEDGDLWWPAQVSLPRQTNHTTHPSMISVGLNRSLLIVSFFFPITFSKFSLRR